MPCQVVSTGAAHLMVPIRDRDAVDRIRPDAKALFTLLEGVGGEGCYVFSLDPRQAGAAAYARFFNPTVGISEDPATGTAAGPLAAHLVANGIAHPGQVIKIEQGTAMGRTSVIQVEVLGDSVKVSGRGVVVASGRLTLCRPDSSTGTRVFSRRDDKAVRLNKIPSAASLVNPTQTFDARRA